MKTRVAIALQPPDDVRHQMARLTMRCHSYGFSLRVLRLPAHISLKQPFVVDDFENFERYFDRLASRIERQDLRFDGYRFWGDADEGVVAVHVEPNRRLRELHALLNDELTEQFGDVRANFDGEDYEFHLTVAIGSSDAGQVAQLKEEIAKWTLINPIQAVELAMYIYEESARPDSLYGMREYGVYKTLPLTGQL